MEMRTLTSRDGFGFVDRSDEDVACAGGNPYCSVIDDASVYFKIVPQDIANRIYDDVVTDRVNYPTFPPGRIPAFYRVFIIVRKFKAYTGRSPKIGEVIRVLDLVEGEVRGTTREDDYQITDILIRMLLGRQLTGSELAIANLVSGGKPTNEFEDRPETNKKPVNKALLIGGGAAILAVVAVGIIISRRRR